MNKSAKLFKEVPEENCTQKEELKENIGNVHETECEDGNSNRHSGCLYNPHDIA
jgi:hypothetical protein